MRFDTGLFCQLVDNGLGEVIQQEEKQEGKLSVVDSTLNGLAVLVDNEPARFNQGVWHNSVFQSFLKHIDDGIDLF